MGECIGLDFGTTYSILSYLKNLHYNKDGEVDSYEKETYKPDKHHDCLDTLSVLLPNNTFQHGLTARASVGKTSTKTYTGFKMLLAERDQGKLSSWGYDDHWTPQAIAKEYLGDLLRGFAGEISPHRIDKVVVGVPQIWFADNLFARFLVKEIISGFDYIGEVDTVSEPAAACAYYVEKYREQSGGGFKGHILVIDYGGGTLDIALCEVQEKSTTSEITVPYCSGVGGNSAGEEMIGKAGMAYMEEVVSLALERAGVQRKQIRSHRLFRKWVMEVEQQMMTRVLEIDTMFDPKSFDPDELFFSIDEPIVVDGNLDTKEYPITYSTLNDAYNNVIHKVLDEQLSKVIRYMDNHNIDYREHSEDNFKVIAVGGFCSFCKTIRQIREKFGIGNRDQRYDGIIAADAERAVSYGAALIANNIIAFRELVPHHFGVTSDFIVKNAKTKRELQRMVKDPIYTAFALKKGDDIQENKYIYIVDPDTGEPEDISCSAVPFFVHSIDDDSPFAKESKIDIQAPLDEYKEQFSFGIRRYVNIGFALDKSANISVKIIIKDQSPERKVIEERTINMRKYETMYGTFNL